MGASPTVSFRLLGPLGASLGDGVVDLGSRKQRAVLAALLLERRRVVPLDRLVFLLWGDEPPARATGSLQVYISNLRRLLEPDRAPRAPSSVILSRPPGYLLDVAADQVDADRFEHLVSEGRSQLAAGHLLDAHRTLASALGTWQGEPLSDLADLPFARAGIAHLEEIRLRALEAIVDAELALDRPADAVARLDEAVLAHPFHERFRAQLMLALYRAGRPADALRAYQDARSVLIEELGIEPGPEVAQLEAAILRHDPSLALATGATAPAAEPGPETANKTKTATETETEPEPDTETAHEPEPEPSAPLFGRAQPLLQLQRALDAAARGEGRAVLVDGEAGVGKSTLVDELARRAAGAGFRVARGTGDEAGELPGYWPWTHVLRDLLTPTARPGTEPASGEALEARADELVALLRGLPDDDAGPDRDAARFRLFDAITNEIGRVAATQPVLIVLDDLHWVDDASLRVLQYAAPALRERRVLIVGTLRPDEARPGSPLAALLGAVAREPSSERVSLRGLDYDAVAEYVRSMSEAPVDEQTVRVIHQRSGGNAFFVTELVRLLASEGRLSEGRDAARSALDTTVPAGVRDVVLRRVERLPAEAGTVLTLASLIGDEFSLDVIEEATGLDIERLLDLVDAALLTQLLVEVEDDPESCRFAHALIRETLAAELSAPRRARLHGRIAEALEVVVARRPGAEADRAGALARHHLEAGRFGDPAKALRFAVRAAEEAGRRLAWEDERHWYEQALIAFDRDPGAPVEDADRITARIDLLIALGEAAKRSTDLVRAREALAEAAALARQLGDAERLARAALRFSGGNWWRWWSDFGYVDDEAIALLAEACAALERNGPPSPLSIAVAGRLAVEQYLDDAPEVRAAAEALADRTVAAARALGDPATLAGALRDWHLAAWRPDTEQERIATAAELIAIARELEDADLELVGCHLTVMDALQVDDRDGFLRAYARAQELTEEVHRPDARIHLRWVESMVAFGQGRLDEAKALMDENLELSTRFGRDEALRTYGGQLLQFLRQRGGLEMLYPTFREQADREKRMALWRSGVALIGAEIGELDAARRDFELLAAEGFDAIPFQLSWMLGIATRAEVCIALGDRERALPLYDLFLPYAGQSVVVYSRVLYAGPVHLFLGGLALVLGRWDDAEQHLVAAAVQCRHMGFVTFLADTLARHVELALRRGDPLDADARRLVDEALAAADAATSTVLRRRIEGFVASWDAVADAS
jgi:DNA-binding SARP family transcriptional activator